MTKWQFVCVRLALPTHLCRSACGLLKTIDAAVGALNQEYSKPALYLQARHETRQLRASDVSLLLSVRSTVVATGAAASSIAVLSRLVAFTVQLEAVRLHTAAAHRGGHRTKPSRSNEWLGSLH